jgi:hypothetical protein
MSEPLLELDDQELELDRQQHPEVAHIANTNSESQISILLYIRSNYPHCGI